MGDSTAWWHRIPWIHIMDALMVLLAVLVLLALTAEYWPDVIRFVSDAGLLGYDDGTSEGLPRAPRSLLDGRCGRLS